MTRRPGPAANWQPQPPTGGKELFLYLQNCSAFMSQTYGSVPSTSPLPNTLDNVDQWYRNSFHWTPLQYSGLSSNYRSSGDVSQLTTTDYSLGHLNHWLLDPACTYLNHGTVGAPPRRVLDKQQAIRDEIERQPSRFMLRELNGHQPMPWRSSSARWPKLAAIRLTSTGSASAWACCSAPAKAGARSPTSCARSRPDSSR